MLATATEGELGASFCMYVSHYVRVLATATERELGASCMYVSHYVRVLATATEWELGASFCMYVSHYVRVLAAQRPLLLPERTSSVVAFGRAVLRLN